PAELLPREGILMRFTDIGQAGKAAEDAVRQSPGPGTHADEIETSMILYLEPGAVRMDRALKDGERDAPGPLRRQRGTAGVYSPSGVFGDPTVATWQKGERIV